VCTGLQIIAMRVIFITFLVLFFYFLTLIKCSADDEFIDPLDMLNYDRLTKSMKKSIPKPGVHEPFQNDRCTIFLSRFINILLINTGLSVSVYTFNIYLYIYFKYLYEIMYYI